MEPLVGSFVKVGGLSFWIFCESGGNGGSDFSHKKDGVGKIEGVLKKGGSHLFSY